MQIPQPQISLASSVVPVSSTDIALHDLIGVSWHMLIPYTVVGIGLMTYGQFRLVRGQKALLNKRGANMPKPRGPGRA